MVTFQRKLSVGLTARNVHVTHDLDNRPYDSVLVIGGTRKIPALLRARREGVPIVQRLDGMNWLHRAYGSKGIKNVQVRHFLRAEYGNIILAYIRNHIADKVVYQSEFVKTWWKKVRGQTKASGIVIHNGVDLDAYKPDESIQRPQNSTRILLVEGSLMGGYEQGLEAAVKLIQVLGGSYPTIVKDQLELLIVGRVPEKIKDHWTRVFRDKSLSGNITLTWKGTVQAEEIPDIDNSAHFLYSSDINAACPNSVIEAMACGLPVLAFDTGALPELVTGEAGRIVPYGGDPWKLDPPDIEALVSGAKDILKNQEQFRLAARTLSVKKFNLNKMIDAYLEILVG
jgi:glycosyltransferase involved in cell wall biosynthesis